jgi:hypothetical protein
MRKKMARQGTEDVKSNATPFKLNERAWALRASLIKRYGHEKGMQIFGYISKSKKYRE